MVGYLLNSAESTINGVLAVQYGFFLPVCYQRRLGNFIQNRLVTRSMTKDRHPDEA